MIADNYMRVKFIDGIGGDSARIYIYDKNDELIFDNCYFYGINASYDRENEAKAARDYALAIENKWDTGGYYCLKPFIGDILIDLCDTFYITDERISYAGFHAFNKTPYTEEEISKTLWHIIKEA